MDTCYNRELGLAKEPCQSCGQLLSNRQRGRGTAWSVSIKQRKWICALASGAHLDGGVSRELHNLQKCNPGFFPCQSRGAHRFRKRLDPTPNRRAFFGGNWI